MTGWGKKVKPPSMILDEDVNGFRATAGGGGKSKKGKKKKQHQQQQAYDPFEPYDPLKPNDYSEYKRFRAQELARRAQKRGRSDESDEENDDERERFYGSRPRRDEEAFEPVDAAPVHIDTSMTGDEAYARRMALSQGHAPPSASAPSMVPSSLPVADADAEEDDDLYVPRIGLGVEAPAFASSSAPLNPHGPAFTPAHGPPSTPAFTQGSSIPPPPPFAVQMPPPPPPAFASGSGELSHAPMPPPPAAPAVINAEAAKARAAAIAARLSKLSAPPPPPAEPEPAPSPDPEHRPDPHGFAARLMAKWGHVEGQGIGARPEESIVVPLTVHAQHQPKGGKNDGQDAPRVPAKMGAGAKSAMGRILNKNENAGREDIVRFGRPSRVVCLTEMCSREDVEDEELRSEIGDECSKFGAVERVLPHLCRDGDVRVFVQYGGEPAAWKCVRELDGRFFGGKTVRARYYPESRWKAGDFEVKFD